MIQRTWNDRQERNTALPVSRGSLPRPAVIGLYRSETSQVGGIVRRDGFTPRLARSAGLIRSGSSVLRVLRSVVSAAAALGGRPGAGVGMI